ncbi:MAG: phosphotransferase [Paludibacteraceae bacterium]|nr:phosphotransferase [Paludibacteraceae bacterium]
MTLIYGAKRRSLSRKYAIREELISRTLRNYTKKIKHLYEQTKTDGVAKRLCHCDCYDPNFLIDKNGRMYLIDWEYSGNDDPGSDLGTFICCSDYTEEEADNIFERYLQRKPDSIEQRHFYAYVALAAYYWFVWAIYQTSVGNNVGEYLYLWYKIAKNYYKKAIKLY